MATMFQRLTSTSVIAALTSAMALVPGAPARADSDRKYEITCESRGWGEQFCAAPNRKVKLVDDFSGRCDKDETWRADERGIYVRNGCAARFRVTSDGYADGGYGYPDDNGASRKKDNTGTIIGAVAIGAGLLWLISQSSKSKTKKTEDGNTGGGDWNNPDDTRDKPTDRISLLSRAERRAFDACDARVTEDVRARGAKRAELQSLIDIRERNGFSNYEVTASYRAIFDSKTVTRQVICQVADGRVTDYRLS